MPTHNNTSSSAKEVQQFTAEDYRRYLLQKVVLDELFKIHKDYGKDLEKTFEPGDRKEIKNAQGVKLGSLSMSAPNKKAVCEDPSILAALAEDKGMELVDVLPADTNRLQDLLDYVYETRPELLDVHISKDDEQALSEEVLENWQITGDIPIGWKIVEASSPRFNFYKGRSEAAKKATEHLINQTSGILELERGEGDK